MNKYTRRMEKTTANAVFRALQKDKKEIQAYLRKLDSEKGFLQDLKKKISALGKNVVGAFIPRVKTTIKKGANEQQRKYKDKIPNYSVDFSVPTRSESVYMRALEDLHLSQRYGSINKTTYKRVKEAVAKGAKEGLTYSQIADDIEKLDKNLFSRNRAELIAINQIGKAYEFGEYGVMKELWDNGYLVMKYWSTVNDSRVTPAHTQNQNNGWVGLPHRFTGTGDNIAPASDHPRCRCAMLYEVGNLRGEKQDNYTQGLINSSREKRKVRKYFEKLEKNYEKETDTKMNWMLEDWEKGNPKKLYEILGSSDISKEEMIAFYWYKNMEDSLMNEALTDFTTNTDVDGMILNLTNFLDKQPVYRGTVWKGISTRKQYNIDKIKNLVKGDTYTDFGFMSTSSEKVVGERFQEEGILLKIQSKTGKDVRKVDMMDEYEILMKPGTSFEYTGKKGNIYFFNEI